MAHGPPAEHIFFIHSKTPYNYMSNQTAPQSRVLLEKQIDWQLIVVLAKKFSQFTKKIQQDATVYQNFISYLYETQHVWGDTPPIIRSLKLH